MAKRFGAALISTSANRSGAAPIVSEATARAEFAEEVDFVLSGEVGGAAGASVIHDLDGNVLRSA